jgi:hypothetical protein
MFEKLRLHRIIAPLAAAAVTALGVGGIAIAQSSNATAPSKAPAAKQAAPATAGGTATDASSEQPDASDPRDAAEPNDPTDAADQTDTETGEQAGEVPGDDGPGGHADEAAGSSSSAGR